MPIVKKTVIKMVPPAGYDSAPFSDHIDARCNFRFIKVEEDVWEDELVEYA